VAEAGYIVVDALVALVVITLTVSLTLAAAQQAAQAAKQARDIRQADALMRDLLVSGPRRLETTTGTTGTFTWSLQTQLTGAEQPISVCRRYVQLTSTASARHYWASTLETCPTADAT